MQDEDVTPPISETDPDEERVQEAEEAAAAEAGAIGGHTSMEKKSDEDRAPAEGGGGQAEGFEQAEEQLVAQATHDAAGIDPSNQAGEPEDGPDPATYGEADDALSVDERTEEQK